MRILRPRCGVVVLSNLILLCPVAGHTQAPASASAFVLLAGKDTVSTQRFTLTSNVLTGEMAVRSGPVQVAYSIQFASEAEPVHVRVTEFAVDTARSDMEISPRAIRFRGSVASGPDH